MKPMMRITRDQPRRPTSKKKLLLQTHEIGLGHGRVKPRFTSATKLSVRIIWWKKDRVREERSCGDNFAGAAFCEIVLACSRNLVQTRGLVAWQRARIFEAVCAAFAKNLYTPCPTCTIIRVNVAKTLSLTSRVQGSMLPHFRKPSLC
jgi:hypothetical protein